jgi:vitamin B12 transporter
MFRILFLLSLLKFFMVAATAGSISGLVLDSSGNPVGGVWLILHTEDKPAGFSLNDKKGHYVFSGLPEGRYQLHTRDLSGPQEQAVLQLTEGQSLHHDISLPPNSPHEYVTVTASRSSAPTALVGSSVTVLEADEIQKSGHSAVADLLREVPGLALVRSGGQGGLTSLFVRGGESDYTKVLVDGIPLNQPGGAVDLSFLSTTGVERIEVVRGPQSALYGSDAVSSVVQIFTRRGSSETPIGVEGFIQGGSFQTYTGGAGVNGTVGGFSYNLEGSRLETDNAHPNSSFRGSSYASRLSYQFSEGSQLDLIARGDRSRTGVPGPVGFGRPDLEEGYRKRDSLAALTWRHQLRPDWHQRISLSQAHLNQLSYDLADSGPFTPSFGDRVSPYEVYDFPFSFLSDTRRLNLNYQSELMLHNHLLTAGVDYERQRGIVGETRARRDNGGLYLQDQFFPVRRLVLTGGARIERHEGFGLFVSPRISSAYLLRDAGANWGQTRIKANYGRGFKEPTFVESFSQDFYFKGDPNLRPERTRSIESGIEQAWGGNRVRAEINFFHTNFRDQIEYLVTDYQTWAGSFFNLGASQAWGAEQLIELSPRHDFRVRGTYTFLQSRILKSEASSHPVLTEGAPLLRRPKHSGSATVLWQPGRWRLQSTLILVGKRSDSDFYYGLDLYHTEGYANWVASCNYRLTPNLEWYAAGQNLLNQQYYEVAGYPSLGLGVHSGVRVRF